MIDSVVYMKMRALTSLTALKIKDIVVPSPASYKHRSVGRELSNISRGDWKQQRYNCTPSVEQAVPVSPRRRR